MVRVKITPRKRKKKVRFLDEVQADSSRPRASYTPLPTNDADILKFIPKKAADQREPRETRTTSLEKKKKFAFVVLNFAFITNVASGKLKRGVSG